VSAPFPAKLGCGVCVRIVRGFSQTLARFRYDEKIRKDKQGFIERVLDNFERNSRRLQLLFLSDGDKSC